MAKPSWLCELLVYIGLAFVIAPLFSSHADLGLQTQLAGIGLLVAGGIFRIDQLLRRIVQEKVASSNDQ